VNKDEIKPLYLFLDDEVLLYAKIKNLKFKAQKENKKDDISIFLNELEKKHPEIKRAVINQYIELI
jgi:tRNA(Ile)-lysidine synthase TilS/MesJ